MSLIFHNSHLYIWRTRMWSVLLLFLAGTFSAHALNENTTYIWASTSNGGFPCTPLVYGGLTLDRRTPYILARAEVDGHLLPCTLAVDDTKARCGVIDGLIHEVEDYQIACGLGLAWSSFFADSKLGLPPSAVVVGHYSTGEPLYACRTIQENRVETTGYLDPTNRYCYSPLEDYIHDEPLYEVLVEVNATWPLSEDTPQKIIQHVKRVLV